MTYIILSLLAFIVSLVAGGILAAVYAESANKAKSGKMGFMLGYGVVTVLWLVVSLFFCVHRVENGHIGLVYTFGKITGQSEPGLVRTMPWQNVAQANVQTQSVRPVDKCANGENQCLSAASSQSQNVFVNTVLNFHVDKHNIQALYTNIGPNYVEKIVQPRVSQVLKEEITKYAQAADVLPHREEIRQSVTARLTDELAVRGIAVEDFLLTNIGFDAEFEKAITNKAVVEQNALAETNKIAVSKAQADQVAAIAEGTANRLRVEAQGQADANRLVSQSLTPSLVQWQTIQKLGPDVKVIMVPANGSIYNLGDVLGTAVK